MYKRLVEKVNYIFKTILKHVMNIQCDFQIGRIYIWYNEEKGS